MNSERSGLQVPAIPRPGQRIRLVIRSDAACEVDDQHALDRAFLVEPSLAEWEEVPVPSVGWDLLDDHRQTHGRMLRVYHIDRAGTFRLLSERLAAFARAATSTGRPTDTVRSASQ